MGAYRGAYTLLTLVENAFPPAMEYEIFTCKAWERTASRIIVEVPGGFRSSKVLHLKMEDGHWTMHSVTTGDALGAKVYVASEKMWDVLEAFAKDLPEDCSVRFLYEDALVKPGSWKLQAHEFLGLPSENEEADMESLHAAEVRDLEKGKSLKPKVKQSSPQENKKKKRVNKQTSSQGKKQPIKSGGRVSNGKGAHESKPSRGLGGRVMKAMKQEASRNRSSKKPAMKRPAKR